MDLSKLTVPQLKALCKERGVSGYSKLGKAALLSKLQPSSDSAGTTENASLCAATLINSVSPLHTSELATTGDCPAGTPFTPLAQQRDALGVAVASRQDSETPGLDTHGPIPIAAPTMIVPARGGQPRALSLSCQVDSDVGSGISTKRALQVSKQTLPPTKKTKLAAPVVSISSVASALSASTALKTAILPSASVPAINSNTVSTNPALNCIRVDLPSSVAAYTQPRPPSGSAKRFKPLKVTKPISSTVLPPPTLPSKESLPVATVPCYLDFPEKPASLPLVPITYPPPLSQRRLVPRWAIILSGLSEVDRRQCILVSKMFRYAVYASAYEILSRKYAGRRFNTMQQQNAGRMQMLNLWPLLRQWEDEVCARRAAIDATFLGTVYRGDYPVSKRLWASPDHYRQLTIAMRFLATRVWFALSIGGTVKDRFAYLRDVVIDVQEVVKEEIWAITTLPGSSSSNLPLPGSHTVYVLDVTCEPIGYSLPDCTVDQASIPASNIPLRADWANYVSPQVDFPSKQRTMLDRMKWADHAEYLHGVSRHWLTRMSNKGEAGAVLVGIAKRYVMASVVGNSLSGRWMSTTEMAQDFAGLAQHTPRGGKDPGPQMGMYLPAHHHVESAHLTASGGQPLHPALAVIQTQTREYFILRDNGMQVGCEEEGVGEVWQRFLGCNGRGIAVEEGRWMAW
ncbi:hypothetical protein FA95DRAFT_1564602 [Auriscalpium vulgare]|uniref:Uncharacterized protein n=1 Tax=Auriscalpium vulgare TaxID=40419 RepID=A0ACB8REP7_9AGAM|nr:hypothetical protein FA95DRAFT_1564602 [Auriscalpium vulgare]